MTGSPSFIFDMRLDRSCHVSQAHECCYGRDCGMRSHADTAILRRLRLTFQEEQLIECKQVQAQCTAPRIARLPETPVQYVRCASAAHAQWFMLQTKTGATWHALG